MSIVERSIRQPVTVSVVVLLLVIFGVLGLLRVPVQLTPDVDQPVITVTTRWFGASPEEIENEVIEEQEKVLKLVEGLRQMTSESSEGEGSVRLEFYVGVDKDRALNEVRDQLRQVAEYPAGVDEPVVEAVDRWSRDYIAWMLVRPIGGKPLVLPENRAPGFDGDVTELQDFLEDEVRPLLERAEGVAQVQVLGGREREMQVRVNLERLAARGLTIDRLVEALRRDNADASAGVIVEGKREVSVRAVGQYKSPAQIESTVIAWQSDGTPIYIRDVATVERSFKRQRSFVRSLGQDVMALNAQRETGTNVIQVMDGLRRAIDDVNRNLIGPKNWGIELHQVYDQTVYVKASIANVRDDLLLGAALAAGVLFLTLRSLGATLVVAVSIPISIVGTFLGMALTGRNLNVISMAGLSFAIGMGVDNTIVVLENIFRHREMGKDRFQAAVDGASEVWGAIVAATLANIAVFLPVVFIREEAGQLFADISIAISISLVFYMLVSPTVIPMLATVFLRRMPAGFVEGGQPKSDTRLGRLTAPIGKLGNGLSNAFYRLISWMTRGYPRRILIVTTMIGLSLFGAWRLMPPATYLPSGNQNLLIGFVSTPPGYGMDEFRSMAHRVEAVLRPWWEAKLGSSELSQLQQGWAAARDKYAVPAMEGMIAGMRQSMPPEQFAEAAAPLMAQLEELKTSPAPAGIENFFFVSFGGGAFMGATSQDMSNVKPLSFLFADATRGIPGTFAFTQQASIFRNVGFGSAIDLNLSGPDINQVRATAQAVQGAMMGAFGRYVRAEPANFAQGRPETQVHVNRERAASAGVEASTVRRLTRVAVDGEPIGDYRGEGRSIDLTVVSQQRTAKVTDDLATVPLATLDGKVIPMGSVVDLVRTTAPQQISRIEEQPSVKLILDLKAKETIQEVSEILQSQVITPLRESGVIPPSVSLRTAGSADKLQQFRAAFVPGFALAAVITYLLLAALFESWLHPFVIIMSVPFALVGGFLGLAWLHQTSGQLLDVLTLLGFVILIGTIVNNPILIVHQALNYIREGMERNRAIALSTQTRVRPIFMSVITSVAGMAPLVLFGGAGSELYRGLGAVVIGGLLFSTVFTLLLTPTLMSLAMDLQAAMRRLFRLDRPVEPAAGAISASTNGDGAAAMPEARAGDSKTPKVVSNSP
jgi:HAE1 family hydrophobic/amphiphilic exporter-1